MAFMKFADVTVMFSRKNNYVDKDGNALQKYDGDTGVLDEGSSGFYLVENGVFTIEKTAVVTYVNPAGVMPDIDEKVLKTLPESLRQQYKAGGKVVIESVVPAKTSKTEEHSETFEEFFAQPTNKHIKKEVTTTWGENISQIVTVNLGSAVADKVLAKAGKRIMMEGPSWGRIYEFHYLAEPWDGKVRRIYTKKKNGDTYADGRGYNVADYKPVDSMKVRMPNKVRVATVQEGENLIDIIANKILGDWIPNED